MIVQKKYKLLLNSKLPNGTMVSMEFGGYIEEEDADPSELFDKVYASVRDDIKRTAQKDPGVRALWENYKSGLKQDRKFKDSEKD